MRSLTLAVVTMAALAWVMPASADTPTQPQPLFRTPGNAAYCFLGSGGQEPLNPVLKCWTPNDGFTVSVAFEEPKADAPYRKRYVSSNKGRKSKRYPVLRFGQKKRVHCDVSGKSADNCLRGGKQTAFTCTSRSSGLTCKNRAGRGFWLGRYVGYRLF